MKDELLSALKLLKIAYLLLLLVTVAGLFAYILDQNPSLIKFKNQDYEVTWRPKSIETDLPVGEEGEIITYGFQLIVNTPKLIGPLASDKNMWFAGNKLSCNNCHLNAGKKIGSGSFVGVTNRFPQFRGRENKIGTIEERINGCMERSMNGKALPIASKEMQSIIAYMAWLSESVPKDMQKLYKGHLTINIPNRRADTLQGRDLYIAKCVVCHQDNGKGTLKPQDDGYLYPPLGGQYSFNDGSGMNRVITAAQFIKGNMPFGATYDNPLVTDEEAYHLAAYINTFDRPSKANKDADFPDKKLKPASTPYGPWADNFSAEQHKYGPFQPIFNYYKEKYNINKTK